MRALRAIFLFGIALALAYVAGWGLPGSQLALPAGLASFASLGLAIVPRGHAPAVSPPMEGKVKKRQRK